MFWFGRSRSVPVFPAPSCQGAGPLLPEPLESRVFLNATLTSNIAPVEAAMNSGPTQINLSPHFTDPSASGTLVLIQTTQGNIPIQLFDNVVPTTVQNFLAYVNSGEYNNTFIHRVVTLDSGGLGIVQGGGYNNTLAHVTTNAPIPLEYSLPNTTGTIAMARTMDANSATSEFFFNTVDNTQALGADNGGGYAVFGNVIYNGMTTVDAIYGLPLNGDPAINQAISTSDGTTLTSVPIQNYTAGQSLTFNNLVFIKSAAVVSPLLYSATSDNPNLVTPTISNGMLSLNYGSGQAGTANIVVSATDLGGNVVSSTVQVTVGSVLGGRGPRTLRFTSGDGTATTLSMAGPGTADVRFDGANVTQTLSHGVLAVTGSGVQIQSIALSGATGGSSLSIAGRGGDGLVQIGTISADGSVHAISAPQGAVSGHVNIAGSLANLTLSQASGGTITIGGASGILVLNVATLSGETISSVEAVQLQGNSWGTSAAVTIAAPSVRSIAARGEFDVTLNAGSVGNVSAGTIAGGTWTVTGSLGNLAAGSITGLTVSAAAVGRLTERGAINSSSLNSTGNITAISAASVAGSRFNAGAPPMDANGIATAFPTPASIPTVTVGRGGFSNSVINAATLGRVTLSAVTSSNNGVPFGFAAHQILSLLATVDGKKLSLKNVTTADQVAAAIGSAGITPTDLDIRTA